MAACDIAKYLGAGVLIIDTKSSSLLLVNDYTENYNCCGGYIKYDVNDPQRIEKTAMEELYEETRTLFSCEIAQLITCPYVDLNFHDDIFRCYILKMECDSDICEQFEKFNVDQLPAENDYLETSSLTPFPLKQFKGKKSLPRIVSTSMALDSTGKKLPLNKRVISVIQAAVKNNLL
ncbi:unnamed protein product [Adineta steineri]|uniref:Nudix hydrolase domain-containing protein n=1 Tax=Adineta steineri TaxID=433720 RepID=A0A815B3D0_9BILA|nr:unnamed protein product [Adineta steineri]CAF3583513.1 unnamed protein product [Adineta steineri]